MPVTEFIWDVESDNVLMESDEPGQTTAEYTNEPDGFGRLVSQRRDGATSYYQFDGLGSTRELADDTQTVTDTNMYDAWGVNVTSSGTTVNPFQWVGQLGYYLDAELESHYVRERRYSPKVARWLSPDPVRFVDRANLYLYAANRPNCLFDPTGMLTVKAVFEDPNPLEKAKCPEMGAGSVNIRWDFILDTKDPATGMKGAPCDGFIVQKVEIWCTQLECDTCPQCPKELPKGEPDFYYWEAWYVMQGDPMAKVRMDEKDPSKQHTDSSRQSIQKDRCGYAVAKGEIRFYCQNDTDDLNKLWKKDVLYGDESGPRVCLRVASGIPSTNDEEKVKFWKDKKVVDGPAKRHLSVLYNCCPSKDVVTISASPRLMQAQNP